MVVIMSTLGFMLSIILGLKLKFSDYGCDNRSFSNHNTKKTARAQSSCGVLINSIMDAIHYTKG
jgi:hypothetical protein